LTGDRLKAPWGDLKAPPLPRLPALPKLPQLSDLLR
jgi:hypothetical protein